MLKMEMKGHLARWRSA